jgi:hypothetical protein
MGGNIRAEDWQVKQFISATALLCHENETQLYHLFL